MNKTLLIGYGHMGSIHAKYFQGEWEWYDPYRSGGRADLQSLDDFTHFVIATPTKNHYDCYQRVKHHPGLKLIEKPAIDNLDHLHVLDDPKVFVGLVERFNPVISVIKSHIQKADEISFVRTRRVENRNKDKLIHALGIHDIDLLIYLFDLKKSPKLLNLEQSSEEVKATFDAGIKSNFHWFVANEPKCIISIKQKNVEIYADLRLQKVMIDGRSLLVPFCSPIQKEHEEFFAGRVFDSRLSHEVVLSL